MGRLTAEQRDQALEVARAHGSAVAAEWAGVATTTIVNLRKRVDGYERGRGHPTKAEMQAMAVRDDCTCPRCRAARGVTVPMLTPAEQAMVEANTGLVGFVLKRRRTRPEEWDDAFQDGLMGLMRAAQKFEPAKGFKFSTYALFWIRQSIDRGVGTYEGRSYRSTVFHGIGEWAPALSLDAPLEDGELSLADAVLVDDDDPADEALHRHNEARLVQAAMAVCKDDLDRAIMLAVAQGEPLGEVARQFGVAAQTPRNRMLSMRARLRHPVMRKRLGLDEVAA